MSIYTLCTSLLLLLVIMVKISDGFSSPPPTGIYFQLKNKRYPNRCIYSDQTGNYAGMASCDDNSPNQYWWKTYNIIGSNFYLQNKRDNKCVYDDGGDIDVNNNCQSAQKFKWFILDNHGDDANYFRIKNVRHSRCIKGDTSTSNDLDTTSCDNGDGFYWTFYYEDYSMDSITYDTSTESQVSQTPNVAVTKYCDAISGSAAEVSFTYSEEETFEKSFEYSSGFELSIGREISAEIPAGLSSSVSIDTTFSETYSWGQVETSTITLSGGVTFSCDAGTKIKATTYITSTVYDIEYEMIFSADSSGNTFSTFGVFECQYWIISTVTEDVTP